VGNKKNKESDFVKELRKLIKRGINFTLTPAEEAQFNRMKMEEELSRKSNFTLRCFNPRNNLKI
jgi:DNA-binding phage protein